MTGFAAGSTVRVALFPSFMYVRQADGTLSGVAVELAHALGARTGTAVELVELPAPPQVLASLKAGETDIAFLGIDPVRGADVDYAGPLMRADLTFLVGAGTHATTVAEADQPGVRVAVVGGHAMETALRGKLTRAVTVLAGTPDAAFELLRRGEVEVSAGIRPGLIAYASRLPGARVLADRYASNTIALAALQGRPERLAALIEFTCEAKASGLVVQALANTGLQGVEVPARGPAD